MRPAKQRKGNPPSSKSYATSSESEKCIKPTGGLAVQMKGNAPISEATRSLPDAQLYPMQRLDPSIKIKLQLFPIDEATRMGLEKDGHNPYLELTLKARKKISSVLKHIQGKWGDSSVAQGEPILLPYYPPEKTAGEYRWTMNAVDISAGDVYAAIDSPGLFRLRYGWFSNHAAGTLGLTHASAAADASVLHSSNSADTCLQLKDMQQLGSSEMVNMCHEVEHAKVATEEFRPTDYGKSQQVCGSENIRPDQPVNLMGSEENGDGAHRQSAAIWADSLINMSVGGLLSEASLQGNINNSEAKTNRGCPGFQTSPIISDSFEAFIARNTSSQGQMLSSSNLRSSIFDAEETCHAFPQRNSSSKDFSTSSASGYFDFCSKNSPKDKFPKTTEDDKEVKSQTVASQDHSCTDSGTDLLLCSRVYNDERSLGLAGISWTDTLGPFDLGLPSRKTINGDSISISGLAR